MKQTLNLLHLFPISENLQCHTEDLEWKIEGSNKHPRKEMIS